MYRPISTTNAWYIANYNSISIPFGILGRPIFDTNFPIPVLFGAIGTILGHEIVHGFDTSGVQFNDMGYLEKWMDSKSQKTFDDVGKCVSDQYGKFKVEGRFVDGEQTLGENIADNGGNRLEDIGFKEINS